jgi:hypothetical protein
VLQLVRPYKRSHPTRRKGSVAKLDEGGGCSLFSRFSQALEVLPKREGGQAERKPVSKFKLLPTPENQDDGMEPEQVRFYGELRAVGEERRYNPKWAAAMFEARYGRFPPWGWNDLPTLIQPTKPVNGLKTTMPS